MTRPEYGYDEAATIAVQLTAAGVADPLTLRRSLAVCADLGRALQVAPSRLGELLAQVTARGQITAYEMRALQSWGLSRSELLTPLAQELKVLEPAVEEHIHRGLVKPDMLLSLLELIVVDKKATIFEQNLATIRSLGGTVRTLSTLPKFTTVEGDSAAVGTPPHTLSPEEEAAWRRANPGYPVNGPLIGLRPGLVAHRARTPRLLCRLGIHRGPWSIEPIAPLSMISQRVRSCTECSDVTKLPWHRS